MKTPGDYALMHANGMSFKDVVEAIRAEIYADDAAETPNAPADQEGATQ